MDLAKFYVTCSHVQWCWCIETGGNSSDSDDDEAAGLLGNSSLEEDEDDNEVGNGIEDEDDPDDGIDELEELGLESKEKFSQDTKAIWETIDKVCARFFYSFPLIYTS